MTDGQKVTHMSPPCDMHRWAQKCNLTLAMSPTLDWHCDTPKCIREWIYMLASKILFRVYSWFISQYFFAPIWFFVWSPCRQEGHLKCNTWNALLFCFICTSVSVHFFCTFFALNLGFLSTSTTLLTKCNLNPLLFHPFPTCSTKMIWK